MIDRDATPVCDGVDCMWSSCCTDLLTLAGAWW